MDIYTPDQKPPINGYPAVLVIHGGGWRVGDKSDLRQVQMSELLSAHGYLVFNINYTLSPKGADRDAYTRQAYMQCVEALAWAREHAADYSFNTALVGAIGGSAGANMALLLGYTAGTNAFDPLLSGLGEIRSVVNLYGPVTRPKNLRVLDYIHKNGPDVLSIHGDADEIVDIEESRVLDAALRDLGVAHELIIVKDAPHTFNVISKWGDFSQNMLDHFDKTLRA